MGKLKIHVTYCGGWGYAPKFRKIQAALLEEFGADKLEITGEGTKSVSGWLEVELEGGKVLHSKKNGDGYVDSDAKMNKIIQGVRDALSA